MIQTTATARNNSPTVPTRRAAGATAPPPDEGANDLIKLNIGGRIFPQVLRSTLCQAPSDTLFTRIFSKNPGGPPGYPSRSKPLVHYDEEGRIFLDHDPEQMEAIVNFLRMKQIEDPSDPIVEPPEVPAHKRRDFRRLLHHFGLTAFFFYPTTTVAATATMATAPTAVARSVRSMSIDEDPHPHRAPHGLVGIVSVPGDGNENENDDDDDDGALVSDHSTVGWDTDEPLRRDRDAPAPCPLGYDYCYG